jgi:hypothetical protein
MRVRSGKLRAGEGFLSTVVVKPMLAWLEARDYRVTRGGVVFRCMLTWGTIAAADVTAFGASAKMEPPFARGHAFDATCSARLGRRFDTIPYGLHGLLSDFLLLQLGTARSLQRLELIHHSRNKLRHRWMNVHRALYHSVGRLGVHDIEHAMDDLVTLKSQEGGAQYLFVISIHKDFHETLGLTSLIRAHDVLHCHGRDQRRLARLADFRFGHPGTAKRRIGVERVGRDAVAHPSLIVVEKIRCHDLEIIPRRVRERALTIAVAHRPDTGNVGPQLVIHQDIPARVCADTRLVEAKVVSVWSPTRRNQQMSSSNL